MKAAWLISTILLGFYALATGEDSWSLAFKGNSLYNEKQLVAQLGLPSEFDDLPGERKDLLMKLAKANLEDAYYSRGYFNATFDLAFFSTSDVADSSKRHYVWSIKEGEQFRFRNVRVSVADSSRILVTGLDFETSSGGVYDADIITKDLQMVRLYYRRNGYIHVKVDHVEILDTAEHKVDVEVEIQTGFQVKMGSFHSRSRRIGAGENSEPGLSDTTWMRSLWEVDKGEVIDGKYYSDFRTKLFSTQIFSQVKLEDTLRHDGSGLSDIYLSTVERTPGESRFGVFYEEAYGFGGSAYTKHRNLLGSFNEGSISGLLAQNRQEAVLGYANPLLFGTSIGFIPTAIRFDDRIIFNHETLPLPTNPDSLEERYEVANRSDLTFGLHKDIRFRTTGDIRYVLKEQDRLYKVKNEFGLDFVFVDNPYTPESGIRVSPTFGLGARLSGRLKEVSLSETYTYVQLQSAYYFPILRPLLGAIALDLGQFFDQSLEEDARIFYQGGARSVRGYRFRSIFPFKTQASEILGEDPVLLSGRAPRYARISQELRLGIPYEPFEKVQLVEFIDWAKVTDKDKTYADAEEMAVGMGLRYKWEVLTLRLDYTWQKEFTSWDAEPFSWSRITFDLSQAF